MAKKTTQIRKVYVFILEGPSDDNALSGLLKKLYRNRTIYPIIMYGDITSDLDIDNSKIVQLIADKIRIRLKEDKIRNSDVINIFQICDMDGAFIPDKAIVQGDVKGFHYSTTSITVRNAHEAIERNDHKREAIDILLNTTKILGIPYKVFFMSCNLDHVLYDIQNLEDELKTDKADEFYEKYQDCPEQFVNYLNSVAFGVPKSYLDSWEYIKQGCNSLERHNNLFICFKDYPYYAQ